MLQRTQSPPLLLLASAWMNTHVVFKRAHSLHGPPPGFASHPLCLRRHSEQGSGERRFFFFFFLVDFVFLAAGFFGELLEGVCVTATTDAGLGVGSWNAPTSGICKRIISARNIALDSLALAVTYSVIPLHCQGSHGRAMTWQQGSLFL